MYNEGISKVGDLIDIGTAMDIITKRGAFYSYNDMRLGQGREQAKNFLKANPTYAEEIELAIRAQQVATGTPLAVVEDTDETDILALETELEE
jgi:recombination protein RecA